jgi:curved DNA-binding protein
MSVQYKDYYSTLGVPRSASDAEIKKAFRKQAREFHPDVAKDKKRSEEKFKAANEAYEVLGDPAKRKRYDDLGANWKQGAGYNPSSGWGNFGGARGGSGAADQEFQFDGSGFSDFFEQVARAKTNLNAARTSRATSW